MLKKIHPKFMRTLSTLIDLLLWSDQIQTPKEKPKQTATIFSDEGAAEILHSVRSYDSEHDLFINDKSIGFVIALSPTLSLSEKTLDSIHDAFTEPYFEGLDLQTILIASPKIAPELRRVIKARSQGGTLSQKIGEYRAQFLARGAYESLSKDRTLINRHFRLILIASKSIQKNRLFHSSTLDIKHLNECREKLFNTFMANQIQASIPSQKALLALLRELANCDQSIHPNQTNYDPFIPLSEQLMPASTKITHDDKGLLFENEGEPQMIWSSLSCGSFPNFIGSQLSQHFSGQLLSGIQQLPCPFIISLHFKIEKPKTNDNLATKINNPEKEQLAHSHLAKIEENIQKKFYDDRFVKQYCQQGGKLVKLHMQVSLQSTPDKIERHHEIFRRLFASFDIHLKYHQAFQLIHYIALQPFSFSEGLSDDFLLRKWYQTRTLRNAVNLMPLVAEHSLSSTSSLLLLGRRGQLIHFDIFERGHRAGNFNVALSAQSGAGKSVFMQEMIASKLGEGAKVYIIDNGKSYERLVELYGGQCILFDRKNPISFNFFSDLDENDPAFEDDLQIMINLIQVMAKPQGDLDEVSSGTLERITRAVWKKYQNATNLQHIHTALLSENTETAKNIGEMIHRFAYGAHADFFKGPCQIDFQSQITVIDLEDLMNAGDLMQVILCAYISKIKNNIYQQKRDTQKMVVIDEAWRLLAHDSPMTAKFIEEGYRTARKYSCSFITITQNVADFFKSDATKAAFGSSQYKMFMAQSINRAEMRCLTDLDCDIIETLESNRDFSELLINDDGARIIARLILDDFSKALFTTTGTDHEMIKQFRAEGLTLHEAVLKLARLRQA